MCSDAALHLLRAVVVSFILTNYGYDCCIDEKPVCSPVLDDDLLKPLISASSNLSVYPGDAAVVTASINRTLKILETLIHRLYINGCGFEECQFESDNLSDIYTTTCLISNIQGQTEVQFVVISNNGLLCFNISFINIKGLPISPEIETITFQCDGVNVTIADVEEDTILKYDLYDSQEHKLVYSINTTNMSLIISPEVFPDRRRNYTLSITPSNPVGQGMSTSGTITLNDYVYSLSLGDVRFTADRDRIHAVINFKINSSCQLSVPQSALISSNCSNSPLIFTFDDGTTASIPLIPNKQNCHFTILFGTQLLTYDSKNNANIVQNAHWIVAREFINVNCSLLPGSVDSGCTLRVYSPKRIYYNVTRLYRSSEDDTVTHATIGPLSEGLYNIEVFDSWDYGLSIRSTPAFVGTFSISRKELTVRPTSTSSTSLSTQPTVKGTTIDSATLGILVAVSVTFCGVVIILGVSVAVIYKKYREVLIKTKEQPQDAEAAIHTQLHIKRKNPNLVKSESMITNEGDTISNSGIPGYLTQALSEHKFNGVLGVDPAQLRAEFVEETTETRSTELIAAGNKSGTDLALLGEVKKSICEEPTAETTFTSDTSRCSHDPLLMDMPTEPSYKSKKPENLTIFVLHPVQNSDQSSSSQSKSLYIPSLSARSCQKQFFTFPVKSSNATPTVTCGTEPGSTVATPTPSSGNEGD